MSGRITSITSSSLANASAAWTPAQLSNAATPYCIRLTSGAAEGRTFLISTATPNTATTVTIDSEEASQVNLMALGIITGEKGDTYEIIPCDTLSSIFGTPETTGILGGTSSASADLVQLFVLGTWRECYYNTTLGRWIRVGPETNSNNLPVKPDTGILFNRLGSTSLELVLVGRVPSTNRKALVNSSGVTFLATGWPTSLKLGTSGIELIPGWVSSTSPTQADRVQMFVSGAWREYYYTGTQWRWVGPDLASNNQIIPIGTAIILNKRGLSNTSTVLSQARPYSL